MKITGTLYRIECKEIKKEWKIECMQFFAKITESNHVSCDTKFS